MKILFLLTLLITKANAGGAFLYEVGIPDNGWAAAGRPAYASDSSTVYGNPAGLSYLEKSEFMAGIQPKFAIIDFDNNSTPTSNDINLSAHFPGGSIFYATKFSDKVGFGLGLLSFMGLAIDYGDHWEGKNWIEESAIVTLDLVPAFSYKFSDKFSLGLGLDILWGDIKQQFGVEGVTSPAQLTYEDSKFGIGLNAGLLYNFSSKARLGMKWRSPIALDFQDSPSFNNGLTLPSTKMDMTIPQELSVGLFFDTSDTLSLLLGFDWQNWEKFGEFTLQVGDTSAKALNANLENTWNLSLGMIWAVAESEKLTFGLAYDSSAVEDANRTVMLPLAEQFRISAGYMVTFSDTRMFDFNFTFITSGDNNPVNMAGRPVLNRPKITGNFDPYNVFAIGANYKWKF